MGRGATRRVSRDLTASPAGISLAVLLPAEEHIGGGGSVARWADNVYSHAAMTGFRTTLFGIRSSSGYSGQIAEVELLRPGLLRALHRSLGRVSPRLDGWLYCAAAAPFLRRFDIIHIHNRPHYALLLRRLGVNGPIVVHLHRDESLTSPEYRRRLATAAQRLVFCSHAQRERWVGSATDLFEKTEVIHNGADPALFKPITRKEPNLILYVGRFDPGKGIDLLLDSYSLLLRQVPSARLRIVAREDGSPEYAAAVSRIRQLQESGAAVQFLGEISHEKGLPAVIAEATVLCVPSLCEEAFPLIVVEGMLAGTAVVATRSGGIPEALQDCGELADKAPASVAASLAAVLTNAERRRSLEIRGRQRALERFTWQYVADNTLRVLRQSFDSSTRRPVESPGPV